MILTDGIKCPTLKAISLLAQLIHFSFYVCGSRRFGDFTPESDFDFIIEDSNKAELIPILSNHGLQLMPNSYLDENTVEIYGLGQTQVIFVVSLARRLKAMDYIRANKLDRNNHENWDTYYAEHPAPCKNTIEDAIPLVN